MCTMIVEKANIDGSGKGVHGWFKLREVNVSYDHPFHAPLEHALNLDFVNEAEGLEARVAVELDPDSARALVGAILAALARAEAEGHLAATETVRGPSLSRRPPESRPGKPLLPLLGRGDQIGLLTAPDVPLPEPGNVCPVIAF